MIWRRVRVLGSTTIADLHHTIQIAMGWDNDYLHCFHIHGKDYGIAYEGGISFSDKPQSVHLDDFGFNVGDRFTYLYNFNDYWLSDIRIESIQHAREIAYPIPYCLSGKGKCGEKIYNLFDELDALSKVLYKIVHANDSTTVGDIRSLIEDYESVRFNRQSINMNLAREFPPSA